MTSVTRIEFLIFLCTFLELSRSITLIELWQIDMHTHNIIAKWDVILCVGAKTCQIIQIGSLLSF